MRQNYPNKAEIVEYLLSKNKIIAPPVKLSEIVKSWDKLQVTFDEIDGDAYLVDLGVVGKNILIRKKAPPERQRFSLAHEIGHLVLKDAGINLHESTVKSRNTIIERWCNEFASELLMPSGWIQNEVLGSKIVNIFRLCHKLAEKYQVSFDAMLIRLTETTPINVARYIVRMDSSEIKYNKSKICPINIKSYETKIFPELNKGSLNRGFFLDDTKYCFIQAHMISHTEKKWIWFLMNTDKSLTIGKPNPR
jgi:Zn-dependent peptidase ImmA (M78 family)